MFTLVVSTTVVVAGIALMYFRHIADSENLTASRAAYILDNQVTHARLLPKPSTHAFAYSTLAFLVSLDALESHSLDLARGWLFGYGGTSWRVTGIHSAAYLVPDVERGSRRQTIRSIKEKLREVLQQFGHESGRLGDVWTLTMPSYLGYEGINPLTVHYCYAADSDGTLAWVVLEIHNTFGEKHVHVLQPGRDEDQDCARGYEHQWTFSRDFHVSPFNDRLGHYTVSIVAPPPPCTSSSNLRPKIRIHLHAPSEEMGAEAAVGPLKLTATMFARRAVPLTSVNLVHALARQPVALLLSFARIIYHAWILHYAKRLDVFPRPDPKPPMLGWGFGVLQRGATEDVDPKEDDTKDARRVYGGIGWQDEGLLEAYARRIVERCLTRRANDFGVDITLVPGDPSVPQRGFSSSRSQASGEELVIHYAAPRFFSTLLLAPSAAHMLLIGRTEDLFRVNSESLFTRVFTASSAHTRLALPQRLRTSVLPQEFLSLSSRSEGIPSQHILDHQAGFLNALVISLMHLMDSLEKKVFILLRARFVPGTEPWGRWERAAEASRR